MASVVISQKDYAVGDLIYSEMPMVNVLYDNEKSKFCDNCLCPRSDIVKLKKCSACKHMYYCSPSCQSADWSAGHMYECTIYQKHYSYLESEDPRLLLRTHLLLKNKPELAFRKVKLQFDESAAKSFNDLGKTIDASSSRLEQLKSAFDCILNIFVKCGIKDFDRQTLSEYFNKQVRNAALVFYKKDFIASGLYLSKSAFKHSCEPNATRSFNGYRMDTRAIKEIKRGQPITISLVKVDFNRAERQEPLQRRYLIDCKCKRCTSNFDRVFDYDRTDALKCTMDFAEETGYFVKAFEAGKKLISMYQILGGYEFTVSWHLMRVVEFYQKMSTVGQDESIVDVLETTVRHLKVSHGVDHPHFKEYMELWEKYQNKFSGNGKKWFQNKVLLGEEGSSGSSNYAISTKDYAVGDLICSEMPFASVVQKDAKSKYCESCLCPRSKTVKLTKCSACKNMYYCSLECESADLEAGHKYECEIYKYHYKDLEEDDPRLLLRTHLLLENNKELAFRKVTLHDESVAKSFSNLNKIQVEESLALTYACSRIFRIFDDCNIKLSDRDTLSECFAKQSRNTLPVFYKYDYVGYGIYTSPSVFGHSCAPNATRSFNGYREDIRAIKEIKKGEQITISMVRVDTSREKRQSFLKRQYLIACECQRCNSNFDNEFNHAHMESLELEMNTSAQSTKTLRKAIQAGSALIPLYEHLGGYDITVSWHLMRMVEFYRKMPAKAKAHDDSIVDILETTVRHLKVTHGIDHPHYKEYSGLLEEFRKKFNESDRKSSKAAGDF